MEEGNVEEDIFKKIPERLGEVVVDPSAFVAPGAVLVGSVTVAEGASIWYGCVLRGDITPVTVGELSNVQDGAVLHVDFGMPCALGARVTVGHRAVIHGAEIADRVLVGMGAVVLSGAKVGEGSIVAAGAVVPEGMEIPSGVVAAGVPAKVRREISDRDRRRIDEAWRTYERLAGLHRRQAGG